jgi:O-antigen ligase
VLVGSVLLAMVTHALLEFVFDVDILALVAQSVGRNPDLTGRTHIWEVVLGAGTNPLLGTGYEAFWLGPRLEWVWSLAGDINVAHNGYIEIYLTGGLIGLALVLALVLGGLADICRRFFRSPMHESFGFALWTVVILYNITESALRGSLLWTVFLLYCVVVPRRATIGAKRIVHVAPRLAPRIQPMTEPYRPRAMRRESATQR